MNETPKPTTYCRLCERDTNLYSTKCPETPNGEHEIVSYTHEREHDPANDGALDARMESES